MAAAVRLRDDFGADRLRSLARGSKDGPRARRLLALAAIYEGATRGEAAKIGGVTLQIVRDWGLRFNAFGPYGLLDRTSPGAASLMQDAHRAALADAVEDGPIPAVHGVVRWRIVDLCQWLLEEFRLSVSETTMSRELRKMGYRKLSARPRHHAQREGAIEEFKNISLNVWKKSPAKRTSTSTR
jgi:transposase